GWQSQAHGRTVQDHLERAIGEIAGGAIRLHCAGRTDTGVHATAQIAHFDCAAERPLNAWVRGVNTRLQVPITVRWAQAVDDDFHARFCAVARRYRYVLHNSPTRPALLAARAGWFHLPLAVDAMSEAASRLIGHHDFTSFRAAGCQGRTPMR